MHHKATCWQGKRQIIISGNSFPATIELVSVAATPVHRRRGWKHQRRYKCIRQSRAEPHTRFHGEMKLAATILMKVGGPRKGARLLMGACLDSGSRNDTSGVCQALLCYRQELCDAAISGARTGMRECLQRLPSFNLCVVLWPPPCLSPCCSFLSIGGCGMYDKSPDIKTARRYRSRAAGCISALRSWFLGCNVIGGQEMLRAFWLHLLRHWLSALIPVALPWK